MTRVSRLLVVSVGFGVLGFVMSLVPQKNATGAGGAPVTVINPSLPVTQSGTWNVGITGTPNVSVGNFPAALTGTSVPVSVQRAANFKTLLLNGTGLAYNEVLPDGTVNTGTAFTISQGEQLVITDVSWVAGCVTFSTFTCSLSAGDAVVMELGNGSYVSEATYANREGGLFAGRSDHLTSGIVVNQLPSPTIFGGAAGSGESIALLILQGYLAP